MAISPVGPLGASAQQEPGSGGGRSDRHASRPAGPAARAGSPDGDRVVLSETARALSRVVGEEALQLHLSPAELRAMIAPESAEAPWTPRGEVDSPIRPEERHVR